jgi:hypothetical protein
MGRRMAVLQLSAVCGSTRTRYISRRPRTSGTASTTVSCEGSERLSRSAAVCPSASGCRLRRALGRIAKAPMRPCPVSAGSSASRSSFKPSSHEAQSAHAVPLQLRAAEDHCRRVRTLRPPGRLRQRSRLCSAFGSRRRRDFRNREPPGRWNPWRLVGPSGTRTRPGPRGAPLPRSGPGSSPPRLASRREAWHLAILAPPPSARSRRRRRQRLTGRPARTRMMPSVPEPMSAPTTPLRSPRSQAAATARTPSCQR